MGYRNSHIQLQYLDFENTFASKNGGAILLFEGNSFVVMDHIHVKLSQNIDKGSNLLLILMLNIDLILSVGVI